MLITCVGTRRTQGLGADHTRTHPLLTQLTVHTKGGCLYPGENPALEKAEDEKDPIGKIASGGITEMLLHFIYGGQQARGVEE